ncbi:hypothetical protein HMPREF1981_00393, partial [Bacteroides pyogenes F0041]
GVEQPHSREACKTIPEMAELPRREEVPADTARLPTRQDKDDGIFINLSFIKYLFCSKLPDPPRLSGRRERK